jgi:hypothetical protein
MITKKTQLILDLELPLLHHDSFGVRFSLILGLGYLCIFKNMSLNRTIIYY